MHNAQCTFLYSFFHQATMNATNAVRPMIFFLTHVFVLFSVLTAALTVDCSR